MTTKGIPRFVKLAIVGVLLGTVLVLVAAWQISDIIKAEEQSDCERAVGYRQDTRAMWLWLGQKFPKGAAELGLRDQLDQLVPKLQCVDGNPTPVGSR